MWYKVTDGALAGSSGATPRLPGISNASTEQLAAAGWYQYDALPLALRQQIDAANAASAAALREADISDSMERHAITRAVMIEGFADYVDERNAINALADLVLGVGVGPRLEVESLAEYVVRRRERYRAIV